MSIIWIESSWVNEFSVVILSIDSSLSSQSNRNELINSLLVGGVFVKVILEVLKHVHVLLNEVISSYFLEWEGFVIKLIGVHFHLWVLSLFLQFTVDLHSSGFMLLVEVSGEETQFVIHVISGDV